jgi:30S ribosomal protein S31
MGKGDKKTRRGKLFMGSFGKKRLRKQDSDKSPATEKVVKVQETKPVRERKEKHTAEVNEAKAPKEKSVRETKPVKEKKEEKAEVKAPKEAAKPKKEKKTE